MADSTNPVLATVNGEAITQADVDFMLTRLFGNPTAPAITDSVKEKALQSLIASSAMRQVVDKTLSTERKTDLAQRVRAFEEELYVKEYLSVHAKPMPIDSIRIQDYYDRNPTKFGGGDEHLITMLSLTKQAGDAERNQFIALSDELKKQQDWASYAKSSSLNLRYQEVTLRPGLMDATIEQVVTGLKPGNASDVFFSLGKPYIVRLTSVRSIPPKPLAEVRDEIRKILGAEQMRTLVKRASEQALESAEVVREGQ
ncbi:peptidylprolyl isomerase [Arenicella chitinivorans]|nr:peptidylprolyl isomerase [Arenicella chitinivorans]